MNKFDTSQVCAKSITFSVNNNTVTGVCFNGGCDGNLQGISSLIDGMNIDMAIEKLSGITCGRKTTSCPDQLAKALTKYKNNINNLNFVHK